MAEKKADDLAKLLAGMAEGQNPDIGQSSGQVHDVHVELGPSSAPAPPAPPPATAPATAPPTPPTRPAPPPPPSPRGYKPPTPRTAASRPTTPSSPVLPPSRAFSRPAPVPHAPEFVVSDDREQMTPEDDADDAVIVPAPPAEVLAHVSAPARAISRPVARSNNLFLKRTLIPILVTLGLICPAVVVIGFNAEATSPYAVLRQAWFAIPFLLIGVVMLGLGVMTMLQVKHELDRRRR